MSVLNNLSHLIYASQSVSQAVDRYTELSKAQTIVSAYGVDRQNVQLLIELDIIKADEKGVPALESLNLIASGADDRRAVALSDELTIKIRDARIELLGATKKAVDTLTAQLSLDPSWDSKLAKAQSEIDPNLTCESLPECSDLEAMITTAIEAFDNIQPLSTPSLITDPEPREQMMTTLSSYQSAVGKAIGMVGSGKGLMVCALESLSGEPTLMSERGYTEESITKILDLNLQLQSRVNTFLINSAEHTEALSGCFDVVAKVGDADLVPACSLLTGSAQFLGALITSSLALSDIVNTKL